MKTLSKPLAVLTITSCLTTLQFSSLAWAQEATELKMGRTPISSRPLDANFATPSLILAPQKGFEAQLGYSHMQGSLESNRPVLANKDVEENSGRSSFAVALTPHYYLGASIGYLMKEESGSITPLLAYSPGVSTEQSGKGIGDPTLTAGARWNRVGLLSVVAELNYEMSSGNKETTRLDMNRVESNSKTGGNTITPQVTVFTNSKSTKLFGGLVNYQIKQDRTELIKNWDGRNVNSTIAGGNIMTVTLFMETPQDTHSLGLAASYIREENQTIRESGVAISRDGIGTEVGTIMGFGTFRASENFAVIPSLGYSRYLNEKLGDMQLSEQNMFSGAINARLLF